MYKLNKKQLNKSITTLLVKVKILKKYQLGRACLPKKKDDLFVESIQGNKLRFYKKSGTKDI